MMGEGPLNKSADSNKYNLNRDDALISIVPLFNIIMIILDFFFGKAASVFSILLIIPVLLSAQNMEEDGIQKVKIVDHFVIGDDVSKPLEYRFGKPRDIANDSKNNMYVADEESMNIKVYNPHGEYLRTIGERGRGPGEFLNIRALNINPDGELLAVDGLGFRITKFNTEGEVLETYPMSKKEREILFFNQFTQLPNQKYIVLYKKFGKTGNEDEILHIWDRDLAEKQYSFGSFKKLDFDQGFETEFAKGGLGSMSLSDNKSLLFAPISYEGSIYLYEKKGDKWSYRKDIQGYSQLPDPHYEVIEVIKNLTRETLRKNNIEAPIKFYSQSKAFMGDIYSTSAGIFTLNNGYTVHFIFIKTQGKKEKGKGTWKLGAELFDKDFNYLGYFPLRSFQDLYIPLFPAIKAKDNDDNFYMLSREGYPVVRKFSLDIQYK